MPTRTEAPRTVGVTAGSALQQLRWIANFRERAKRILRLGKEFGDRSESKRTVLGVEAQIGPSVASL